MSLYPLQVHAQSLDGQFVKANKEITLFLSHIYLHCSLSNLASMVIFIKDTKQMSKITGRKTSCPNTGSQVQISGQRESFFQSRDENESFSDLISFIETRPRIPDTYSQASRRD